MKVAKNNFAKLPEGSKWYVSTCQTPRNTLESLSGGPLTLRTRAVLPPLGFFELATVIVDYFARRGMVFGAVFDERTQTRTHDNVM